MESSSQSTIVDVLEMHARERGDRTAFIYLAKGEEETGRQTFSELSGRAQSISARLVGGGFAGKPILLLIPGGREFVDGFLGCLYAGAIPIPVIFPGPGRPLTSLLAIIRDAQVACIMTTRHELVRFQTALAHESYHPAWLCLDEIDPAIAGQPRTKIDPDDPAFLQYTSGSTGMPKGVVVTHRNLMHNEAMIQRSMRLSQESTLVSWLPLFHDMGLIGSILQPIYTGFACVLMPPAAFLQWPLRWLKAISKYRATVSGGPNFSYDLCVDRVPQQEREGLDLSSWAVAYSGSEPVRAETVERFITAYMPHGFKRTSFFPCYGMAESTLFVTGADAGRGAKTMQFSSSDLAQGKVTQSESGSSVVLVACGSADAGVRVVIVDPETRCIVPQGAVGEIWICGGSVSPGYYGKPELNSEIFCATLSGAPEQRFLRTGDLGFLHEDELYITGRTKDVIIIRGRKHYPQDLEATAGRSNPLLMKAGGAAITTSKGGQLSLAIIHELTREGWRLADPGLVAGDVREAISAEHGLYASHIVLIRPGTLPRTTSGKIRRAICREMLEAGQFEGLTQDKSRQPHEVSHE